MLVLALAASALAIQASPSLDRLYSLPWIIGTAPSSPAWSVDGTKLAFLWNESGYDFKDVYLVDVDSTRVSQLTRLSRTEPPREGDPGVVMRLGKDVDFVSLPDAGHGWDLDELHETRFAFRKLVEFFDRHLKEVRDE